jgi:regulator of protease activity HflC (stomatin/prohibitin superfamily)
MESLLKLVVPIAIPATIFLVWFFSSAIRVVSEYERGVIFRLGRLIGAKGPGFFFLIPWIDRMVKVDLRTITMDVPAQEVITRDNAPVKVNAVVYFRVTNPADAVNKVQNFIMATSQIAQTTLRSVVGQATLDEVLSERESLNQRLQQIIDQQTDPWGVKVSIVEIKDAQVPEQMQRAMAQQAEAERERRAKIIHAEGELQASVKLAEAAKILSQEPAGMQLRFLQTAQNMANEKSTTTFFPLPLDLIEGFFRKNSPPK